MSEAVEAGVCRALTKHNIFHSHSSEACSGPSCLVWEVATTATHKPSCLVWEVATTATHKQYPAGGTLRTGWRAACRTACRLRGSRRSARPLGRPRCHRTGTRHPCTSHMIHSARPAARDTNITPSCHSPDAGGLVPLHAALARLYSIDEHQPPWPDSAECRALAGH